MALHRNQHDLRITILHCVSYQAFRTAPYPGWDAKKVKATLGRLESSGFPLGPAGAYRGEVEILRRTCRS